MDDKVKKLLTDVFLGIENIEKYWLREDLLNL